MSTHQEYNVPTMRERRFAVEWAVETRLKADCLKRDDKRCVATKRFDELSTIARTATTVPQVKAIKVHPKTRPDIDNNRLQHPVARLRLLSARTKPQEPNTSPVSISPRTQHKATKAPKLFRDNNKRRQNYSGSLYDSSGILGFQNKSSERSKDQRSIVG
ncbi:uncharacterized protein N7518_006378 [Penicillium psychrosexuale]|uniref:uncharacterized protein n=1 Tax=Penicillium psychrosexuale TaxID=1002107 RepID=UPI0025455FAE|nr:uncharacterized protein N7518_006378 [Penicillium psychrosexuale]KAJ5789367.1 hypothetical protein N7518_006378 [Penicillium psychrosexuale]